jgi:hypothetical protein
MRSRRSQIWPRRMRNQCSKRSKPLLSKMYDLYCW